MFAWSPVPLKNSCVPRVSVMNDAPPLTLGSLLLRRMSISTPSGQLASSVRSTSTRHDPVVFVIVTVTVPSGLTTAGTRSEPVPAARSSVVTRRVHSFVTAISAADALPANPASTRQSQV
jgi:hypothetical protein